MEINIENEKYMCEVIGKPICVPQLSDFGITQNDLETESIYNNEILKHKKKINGFKDFFALFLCPWLTWTLILFSIYHIRNSKDIAAYIVIYVIYGIFFYGFYIYSNIGSYFESIFTTIAKSIYKSPTIHQKHFNVINYRQAYDNYLLEFKNLQNIYYGIGYYNYNFDAYCSAIIIELVKQLQRFTSIQNGIIIKDNLRQEQNYWFNLDPYEFEEEVAHWFAQQGYSTEITKKSGDEGIDIKIKKENYIGYVQCKRYTTSKVDRPTLNALYGVVSAYNATQGIIVCLQGVTSEAKEFAKRTNIRIITIEELAPEESLFYHKIHKDTIYENPTKVNLYWCKVGNITLNTRCYIENSSAFSTIKEWNDKDNNHVLQYKNIYFILHCTNENFCEFTKYLESLKKETNKTKQNRNYKKNRKWYRNKYYH